MIKLLATPLQVNWLSGLESGVRIKVSEKAKTPLYPSQKADQIESVTFQKNETVMEKAERAFAKKFNKISITV